MSWPRISATPVKLAGSPTENGTISFTISIGCYYQEHPTSCHFAGIVQ
ncbi:MAG: hypothetical protein ACLTQJ_22425 [[Clostridium] innocuum]